MYEPVFNAVVVQIDDKEAAWGGDKSDDGPFGSSYNKGKIVAVADDFFPFGDTAHLSVDHVDKMRDRVAHILMTGRPVMWHKGHEGESIFDFNGEKFAMIFWWDLVGVKVSTSDTLHRANIHEAMPEPKQPESKPEDVHDQYGGTTGIPPENDDVKATRKTLKNAGVPNSDTIPIVGGGPENHGFTGVR
jgi:hypothetical protein